MMDTDASASSVRPYLRLHHAAPAPITTSAAITLMVAIKTALELGGGELYAHGGGDRRACDEAARNGRVEEASI